MAASPDGAQLAVIVWDSDVDPITYTWASLLDRLHHVGDGQPVRQSKGEAPSTGAARLVAGREPPALHHGKAQAPGAQLVCELVSVDVASGATRDSTLPKAGGRGRFGCQAMPALCSRAVRTGRHPSPRASSTCSSAARCSAEAPHAQRLWRAPALCSPRAARH